MSGIDEPLGGAKFKPCCGQLFKLVYFWIGLDWIGLILSLAVGLNLRLLEI